MKKPHSHRAILVLESPWGLDDADANRSSVIPFIEGVAKLAGDTEVFHANFYDKSSFAKALDCLCKTRYGNTTVYIAAHGSERRIGNVDLLEALVQINSRSLGRVPLLAQEHNQQRPLQHPLVLSSCRTSSPILCAQRSVV